MPPAGRVIEAAGGVLWRLVPGGVEVALVHRPKYDDWSVPKGKLNADEHVLVGAVREVWEETGHHGVVGPPLGEINYLKDGAPKRVRYWSMPATGGGFEPTDEVDRVMWLPPREAGRHLAPDRDQPVLQRFEQEFAPTWPLVLVRHGSAGERIESAEADRQRPLDETGRAQAAALVPVLDAFGVRRVVSADVLRCLDTVGPYATRRRLTVESEPLMSEAGASAHPDSAAERLLALAANGVPMVVCTQRRALPGLLSGLHRLLGRPAPADVTTRKGAFWALHLARDEVSGQVRLVAAERFPAVA